MIKTFLNLFRKKTQAEIEHEVNQKQIKILQKEIEKEMAKRKGTILKYKRKWNGSYKYYFKKFASNGEVLFNSPAYQTRSGRDKAVRKIVAIELIKVVNE